MARSRLLLGLLLALLTSCKSAPKSEDAMYIGASAADSPQRPYTLVKTYFATDRRQSGVVGADAMFSDRRGELTYGVCQVSVPPGHVMGVTEEPSVFKLEFNEDPRKHVVLLATSIRDPESFFSEIAATVSQSQKSQAFVFVHGYNVTFEDAARRTAQMAYDLQFSGAPIFYSWPSRASVHAYTIDEQNIEWSETNIKSFLKDFFARSQAERVYLIAHSMGSRGLARAVGTLLAESPEIRPRLAEVILAAPDIDAEVFRRDIAPQLVHTDHPMTLYASSNDWALAGSKKVHGAPRIGDSGSGLCVMSGVETVDASAIDTSLLGHSYYGSSRSILSDIHAIMTTGTRANSRFGLAASMTKDGRYWVIRP